MKSTYQVVLSVLQFGVFAEAFRLSQNLRNQLMLFHIEVLTHLLAKLVCILLVETVGRSPDGPSRWGLLISVPAR